MEIQVVQFDERVGMGTFYPWLAGMGIRVKVWRADLRQLPTAGSDSPILLLGGHMGVNQREQLDYLQVTAGWLAGEVERQRPLLAICLGGQLLAHALGATVHSQRSQEKGVLRICLTVAGIVDPLFAGLESPFTSFAWHDDSFELPAESTHLASTQVCPGQAFRCNNAWGVQFHPEVDERIVDEWCQRTGTGEAQLKQFQRHRDSYFAASRRLLENFVATVGLLPGG